MATLITPVDTRAAAAAFGGRREPLDLVCDVCQGAVEVGEEYVICRACELSVFCSRCAPVAVKACVTCQSIGTCSDCTACGCVPCDYGNNDDNVEDGGMRLDVDAPLAPASAAALGALATSLGGGANRRATHASFDDDACSSAATTAASLDHVTRARWADEGMVSDGEDADADGGGGGGISAMAESIEEVWDGVAE